MKQRKNKTININVSTVDVFGDEWSRIQGKTVYSRSRTNVRQLFQGFSLGMSALAWFRTHLEHMYTRKKDRRDSGGAGFHQICFPDNAPHSGVFQ